MAAEFAARYLGLAGLALHDLDGMLIVGQGFRIGGRLVRRGSLRRGHRRRRRQPVRLDVERLRRARVVAPSVCNPFSAQSIRNQYRRRRLRVPRDEVAGRRAPCGVGESSDGYHMSAPDPDGRGAEIAIRAALAQAGRKPADVGT